MDDIAGSFAAMPPITRFWLTGTLATTIVGNMLGLAIYMVMYWPWVVSNYEARRVA